MVTEAAIIIGILFMFAVLAKLIRNSLAFPALLRSEIRSAAFSAGGEKYSQPLVSVIIPARDEGRHIAESVRRILDSEGCRLELILVDDRSSDDTFQIMKQLAETDSRIRVASIRELPPDWTGKTHAMFLGGKIASGEILVFTDADAVLSPYALCTGTNLLSSKGLDFLSLMPGFTKRRFIEDAIFPILAAGLLHYLPLTQVNDLTRPAALASGPFLMITRQAYEKIGTWSLLKNEITEDIALAKAVKRKGMRLMVMRASDLVQVEPFRTIPEVFRYWERVYYGGFDRDISKLLGTAANHASLFTVYVLFAVSGMLWVTQPTPAISALFALATTAVGIISVLQIVYIKREHGNWIYALASPFAFLIGAAASLSAFAAIVFHKRICWHGSCYQ